MNLWSEYEGKTIAGTYPLEKLLRSEGRNALFATSNGDGQSAVIRLTEAHFDEEETLKLWRQAAEIHQDNLIRIKSTGKTTCDGVALTYALLEPDDANLDEVLRERPLTPAETMEVAKSLSSALLALHKGCLVHGHVEASNVLAVGEVVKLRSDCVRECVADAEFVTPENCAELRGRDIHDFGMLLLRCLTLEKSWHSGIKLPKPFDVVIPCALDGSWDLVRMEGVLNPPAVARSPATSAPYLPTASQAGSAAPKKSAAMPQKAVPAQGKLSLEPETAPGEGNGSSVRPSSVGQSNASSSSAVPQAPSLFLPRNETGVRKQEITSPRTLWIVGAAAVALLLVFFGWYLLREKPAKSEVSTAVPRSAPPAHSVASAVPQPHSPARSAGNVTASVPQISGHAPSGWYVIALAYNNEGAAKLSVDRIAQKHPDLHPQVFSATGHPPFLVSLGGAMSKDQAVTVLRQARRSGLPRDTFIRKY